MEKQKRTLGFKTRSYWRIKLNVFIYANLENLRFEIRAAQIVTGATDSIPVTGTPAVDVGEQSSMAEQEMGEGANAGWQERLLAEDESYGLQSNPPTAGASLATQRFTNFCYCPKP